jgi:hypothetical protein
MLRYLRHIKILEADNIKGMIGFPHLHTVDVLIEIGNTTMVPHYKAIDSNHNVRKT